MNNNQKDGQYAKCVLEKTPESLAPFFSFQHPVVSPLEEKCELRDVM